ncbi:hypothetical protein Tco_0820904 [Tanacetum coccineum]|uniref:Uncharacterized protein n=1 Tax=Tanacetum coccineum TaxID=301880 RepID=A0ABQ5AAQ7_9ASTR
MEVSRLSGMDNDLFTYKVEVANIPCNSIMDDDLKDETDDDMGYDPSDVAFIEWLRSKITTDQFELKDKFLRSFEKTPFTVRIMKMLMNTLRKFLK